jgi:hypothetical protein
MTETSQLNERHGDLAAAVDELLDAVAEAGPNEDEHEAVLLRIAEQEPAFFVHVSRLAAHRKNDDASAITADSAAGKAVVKVCDDQGASVVDLLQDQHADRLLAALVNLGISARLNGLTKWEPPAAEAE